MNYRDAALKLMDSHDFSRLLPSLQLLKAQGFGNGAALATLLRTRGSTFRRAGARMLVHGDGTMVRGLSAGCPDADIAANAREAIACGAARIVRYDREHGYDVLLELGCGGELEVLVEPLCAAANLDFVDAISRCLQARRPGLMATVFARDGHCLPQPRRLVWGDQVIFDGLAEPSLTDALLAQFVQAGEAGPDRLERIDTRTGTVDVFVEHLRPPLRLVLVGSSLIATALARMALTLGWQVLLVDHRAEPWCPELPEAAVFLRADPQTFQQRIVMDTRTAVVVVTHNLERDIAYLRALSAHSAGYVGALGSRNRAEKMRQAVGGLSSELHTPAGLDIGSETPEEIALSIAAEIQAVMGGRAGGGLSTSLRPIH